jgi:hypothetical protein
LPGAAIRGLTGAHLSGTLGGVFGDRLTGRDLLEGGAQVYESPGTGRAVSVSGGFLPKMPQSPAGVGVTVVASA